MPKPSPFKNKTVALGTMHKKELVIQPLLEAALGLEVVVPKGFNSDQFGTFTREKPRPGSQLEAARAKARAALWATGADFGLASEGSFGSHPSLPLLPSNLELLVLIDASEALEIIGQYRSNAVHAEGQIVHSPAEALQVARSWGFPKQGVILRRSQNSPRYIYKELTTEDALIHKSQELFAKWSVRSLFLETDMRAHRCPSRMETISHATENLIENCQTLCSKCGTPGFAIVEVKSGLPCSVCGMETDTPKETLRRCQRCQYAQSEPYSKAQTAEPATCPRCNP